MIFTAYLDESGTHDGSDATIMGGYMAAFREEVDTRKAAEGVATPLWVHDLPCHRVQELKERVPWMER